MLEIEGIAGVTIVMSREESRTERQRGRIMRVIFLGEGVRADGSWGDWEGGGGAV